MVVCRGTVAWHRKLSLPGLPTARRSKQLHLCLHAKLSAPANGVNKSTNPRIDGDGSDRPPRPATQHVRCQGGLFLIDFRGLPACRIGQISYARVPLTNCFHVILPRSFTRRRRHCRCRQPAMHRAPACFDIGRIAQPDRLDPRDGGGVLGPLASRDGEHSGPAKCGRPNRNGMLGSPLSRQAEAPAGAAKVIRHGIRGGIDL